MDEALLLSRLQFAWVIALHILLPAFTVGLAAYIAVLEGAALLHRQARLSCACRSSGSDVRGVVRDGRGFRAS